MQPPTVTVCRYSVLNAEGFLQVKLRGDTGWNSQPSFDILMLTLRPTVFQCFSPFVREEMAGMMMYSVASPACKFLHFSVLENIPEYSEVVILFAHPVMWINESMRHKSCTFALFL